MTMGNQPIGSLLTSVAIVLVLWGASGVSWWWFVLICAVGWIVNCTGPVAEIFQRALKDEKERLEEILDRRISQAATRITRGKETVN